jgi:hypothetical protein
MQEVILFENSNFHGEHRHVYTTEKNLGSFNDRTSSIAILEGNWRFYRDSDLKIPYAPVLGPGLYSFVGNYDIENDQITSLAPTNEPATFGGNPINNHVILFEHSDFRGAHKHILTAETNLNAIDDHSFNDKASSIVVIGGNWRFYRNSGFNISYAPVFGPGLYRFVGDWQIENDQISSLRPTNEMATITGDHMDSLGQPADRQLTLFKDDFWRGDHKHVFAAEPNLNDPNDNSFNDNVQSIAVKGKRFWRVYLDSGFKTPTNYMLGAGIHSISESISYSQFSLISSLMPDF